MVLSVVTGNEKKAAFYLDCLHRVGIEGCAVMVHLEEPQAIDAEAVARSKAKQAAARVSPPFLVEDAGLMIESLRGFPGPSTRYALETIGVEGLVRLAASKSCVFESATVLVDPCNTAHVHVERSAGRIATSMDDAVPGAWSDLWRIFIPEAEQCPFSRLAPEQQKQYADDRKARIGSWIGRLGLESGREFATRHSRPAPEHWSRGSRDETAGPGRR